MSATSETPSFSSASASIGAAAPSPRTLWPLCPWQVAVTLLAACAVLGVFAFGNTAIWLLGVWRTDDLKSVGLVVPLISFALILRAWRSVGWETEGTWWGFAVLLGASVLVFLRDQTMLVLTVHKDWLVQLPPVPLLAVLYALGMVLLAGGVRLLRASWFPVLLMGAVLPVPETFSRVVDLPLQHASATVARGFAHLLGEPLTSDNLRLMFTPDFGMFIAPGCNGIRGAVTLGLAALVIAYLYRFRLALYVPVVLGAVLLGYLFNFLRLCLLVVYYKIALPWPWLQDRARGADSLIGGGLFVLALWLFFTVADRLRRHPEDLRPASTPDPVLPNRRLSPVLLKGSAVLLLALAFGLDSLHAQHEAGSYEAALPSMPDQFGGWRLQRTWQDTLTTGVVVYMWGDYALPGSPQTISVGLSPELSVHDVEVCHIARGEDPLWHGRLTATTATGDAVFVAALYNSGQLQTLEASTSCGASGCRQYTSSTGDMTFVYAHPRHMLPMARGGQRAIPVLLKTSTTDVGAPAPVAEARLASELQAFLRTADLNRLVAGFRHPATP
ncbi:MAG: exosortase J [Rhodospirillales bacterium]|nr:exosortase J [Acetobacter sp.]